MPIAVLEHHPDWKSPSKVTSQCLLNTPAAFATERAVSRLWPCIVRSTCVPQVGWLAGNTLVVDFPFPAFPENMGHWAEVLLPIYSQLCTGAWKRQPSDNIDTLLLANLQRSQLQVLRCPATCRPLGPNSLRSTSIWLNLPCIKSPHLHLRNNAEQGLSRLCMRSSALKLHIAVDLGGGVQGLDWVWEMLKLVLQPGLPAGTDLAAGALL